MAKAKPFVISKSVWDWCQLLWSVLQIGLYPTLRKIDLGVWARRKFKRFRPHGKRARHLVRPCRKTRAAAVRALAGGPDFTGRMMGAG